MRLRRETPTNAKLPAGNEGFEYEINWVGRSDTCKQI